MTLKEGIEFIAPVIGQNSKPTIKHKVKYITILNIVFVLLR